MDALRFGVSRSHGGSALVDGAHRFAKALATELERPVRSVVAGDYDQLLHLVLDGGMELAWLPPLAEARADPARTRIAAVSERGGHLTYRSALLVAAQSPVQAPADLDHVRAAWTDHHSSSGYLFPRLHLTRAGFDPRRFASERFYGSSSAACAAVADGAADLCACFVSESAALDPTAILAELRASFAPAPWRLRVLAVTDSIPPDGMVMPADLAAADAMRDALLRLHLTDPGRDAVQTLLHAERLVPVTVEIDRMLSRLRASLPG